MLLSPYHHVIRSQQFTLDYIEELFDLTDFMKKNEFNVSSQLKNRIVAMLFYEPSTRTRLSFESAAIRLGASKITTENAREFSSVSKGETLEDTIKIVQGYSDYIVLRHFEDDSSEIAAKLSSKPVINAGSGKGQHPTQALLDVYTIQENFKRLDNLCIGVVGDLLRGRTVESLVYLLSKFKNNKFYFISPDNSKMKDGLKKYLLDSKIDFVESSNLEENMSEFDVLYMTRVQKERFDNFDDYESAKIILSSENINFLNKKSIIMHPLPRVDEISIEVDNDKRAKYFEQARNGLYVRMAILSIIEQNKK